MGTVPRGASVCRGCGAEVEYGAPKWAYTVALVIGMIAGAQTYTSLPKDWFWIGIVVGIAVFIGASRVAGKLFVKRIIFHRHYRSK
jgi:hypothetical protein